MSNNNQKIIELEKKVLELEKLKEQCTLTNEIKDLLNKNIGFNEELKKILDENKEKQNMNKKSWWEYFIRPIPVILYISLIWFIISSITDKIMEYNKTNKTPTTAQVVPNAK